MRLHRLDVTAFGPYPRHESVDFDALAADGLFLLHGDTGAGKTTLLDAVAFALFGVVPGARGETKRLRCDYAAPDVVTEVAVELTVQGHRLRVVRRPEYARPKRRGDGVTKEPAKASLAWVGTPPVGHAPEGLTRIDEVGRTIGRLLGMSAEQFFQVVLLPQGEFARFLRADTAEREQLLEKLFGTQRFADVERWLRDLRTERRQELQRRRQRVGELVARVAQAAGGEPPAAEQRTGDSDGSSGATAEAQADENWLFALRADLASATATAEQADKLAREDRDRAEAELARRLELAARVRRVADAANTLAELAELAPTRRVWAEELAAARRVETVVVADRTAAAVARELADARQHETAASGAVARLDASHRELAVAGLRAQAATLAEEAGGLRQLVAEAETQQADQRRLTELTAREQRAGEIVRALAERVALLPRTVADARAELDAAVRATAQLEGLTSRVAELRAAARDAAALPEAARAAEVAHTELTEAVDRHHRAREALLNVRQRRLAGMAAELAGALAAGTPCPVCGSAEHPQPASAGGTTVSESDERAAAHAEQQAHDERERAQDRAHQADQRLAMLRERTAGRTAEELAGELRLAEPELRAASELARQVAAGAERVRALEAEAAEGQQRLRAAEREQVAAATDRRGLAVLIADRADRLASARGTHASVLARRDHLLALADALTTLADARTSRLTAEQRLAKARQAVTASARQAGFASPEQALAAARDDAAIATLQQRIAASDQREAAATVVLAEPELAGVRPDTEVDLGAAQRLVTEGKSKVEATHAAVTAARDRERAVAELAGRLTAAWAELAPVAVSFAELDALTDVVNGRGQNSRQMSLRSYVLAARLEEVAAAATRRLGQMSQGRFSFVHSDEGGPRGRRGGLGLDVLDDYSGRQRPAKTLSGGESFMASLSLALGLADVVAAETGGAVLDTLFVDEGFGTLDADTLDLVMDSLDELRAGGRVVGLVSHVEELRQRIPVRLRVRKARGGSTIELIGG